MDAFQLLCHLTKDTADLFRDLRAYDPANAIKDYDRAEALVARFDACMYEALDALHTQIKAAILAEPAERRKAAALQWFKRLRSKGLCRGSRFATIERDARLVLRNYGGLEQTRDSVEELLQWLCYVADTTLAWWAAPRKYRTLEGSFARYYSPKTTPQSVVLFLRRDTPTSVQSRLLARLHGCIRLDGAWHVRTAAEWEAVALLIYRCKWFKQTSSEGGVRKLVTWPKWKKVFCNLLQLPPFTQHPADCGVQELYERLKNGEFAFLSQRIKFDNEL